MVFVSAPYSHPIKQVTDMRVRAVAKYCAELLKNGTSCLTPITAGTCILEHTKLPSDFEFWKKMSFDMLEVCNEMHVIMLEGWNESTGVAAEIEFAKSRNIPIIFKTE